MLGQPFGAKVAWDGRRLDVLKAKGEALDAQGYLELDPSFFSDIPDKLAAVDYFEFDVVQAKEIDITKLRLTLPSWATNLDYSGRGDFSGTNQRYSFSNENCRKRKSQRFKDRKH